VLDESDDSGEGGHSPVGASSSLRGFPAEGEEGMDEMDAEVVAEGCTLKTLCWKPELHFLASGCRVPFREFSVLPCCFELLMHFDDVL
jgi:hypothetical protein